jgi:opine dehydrogenase
MQKVAILGAGNGGITAAADLSIKGYEVRLFEQPEYSQKLNIIKEKGGVLLKRKSEEEFALIHTLTTDIGKAIIGAQIVMVTVPSLAIEKMAELSAPFLEKDQIVFLNGATSMSSFRFVNKVKKFRSDIPFKIGETASLTYASRVTEAADVELSLEVKKLLFSAYPSSDTEVLINTLRGLYPCLTPAQNIWETCLNNGNPESHTGPSLLNAGRIEYSNGDFYLYKEGITPSVSKVINAVTEERRQICKAMEVNFTSTKERLLTLGYANEKKDLHVMYNESDVFSSIQGPLSLGSRYFVEDISHGLVLWSSLGKTLTVETPIINSIINLYGALTGKNYWEEGLTLEKLGISGLSVQQLMEVVR